jgi:UPF0716 family protein affecting phage T7 exclusion
MKILITTLLGLLLLSSCTDNAHVRQFGGTENITLNKNEVFMAATWKEADLWITVKDTVSGDYIFREKSSLGVLEGKIIIKSE